MFIETRQDMIRAAHLIMNGTLEPNDISFAEHITDTIKFISDEWNDATNLDYKTSQLILAVQKDVIGIYNYIFNTNIKLNNLSRYDFLIVKFTIKDGCLEYKSKLKIKEIIDSITALAREVKQMPLKNLISLGLILFAVAGAWKAPEIIYEIKRNPDTDEILKSNNDVIAKNQQTSSTIINNLGNGSIIYNGKEATADEYKENMIKKKKWILLLSLLKICFIFCNMILRIKKHSYFNQVLSRFGHLLNGFLRKQEKNYKLLHRLQ